MRTLVGGTEKFAITLTVRREGIIIARASLPPGRRRQD